MLLLRGLPAPIRRLSIPAIAVVAAAATVWFAARHEAADRLLRLGLSGTPLADVSYTVTEVGIGGMALAGVSVPGVGAIDRVEMSWRPLRLLGGRVESVRLVGADIEVRLDGDGVPAFLAVRSPDRGGGENGFLEPPPFSHLVIEDAEVALVHPLGTVRLRLDGALRSVRSSLAGAGRWRADGAFGHASGAVSIESDPVSGRAGIVVSLADAGIAGGGLELGGLSGRIELDSLFDPSAPLRVRAVARAASGRILGLDVGAPVAEGSWDGRAFDAEVGSGVEGGPVSTVVSIASAAIGDRLRIAATGSVDLREPVTLPAAVPLDLNGPAGLDFSIAAFVPSDRPFDLHAADLTGRVDFETGAASLRDRISVEAATLSFDAAAGGRRLELTARPGGTIRGVRLFPTEAAGGIAAAIPDRPFDLTIPPEGIVVEVVDSDDAVGVSAALDASLKGGGDLEGRISVRGDLGPIAAGAPVAFDIPSFEFAASGRLAPLGATGAVRVAGGVEGALAGFDGEASVEARLDGLSAAGLDAGAIVLDLPLRIVHADGTVRAETSSAALLRADRISFLNAVAAGVLAEMPLGFEMTGDRLDIRLTDTAWVDLRALRHPRFRSRRATSVKLEAELLPLLTAERFGEDWSWDARLPIGPTGVRFDMPGNAGSVAVVDGTLPSMGVRFGSLGGRHLRGTVETGGGDLRVEGPDIRLADIRVLFTYDNGLSGWPQAAADIRLVEDLREPARFAPLAADISVMPVWPPGDDVRLNGSLHMDGRRFLANVEASYRPSDDLFRALVRVPPIGFERGGSQPGELSPLYGGLMEEVSGAVGLRGRIAVDDGVASSDLALSLLDLSGRNGDVAVEGLEGEVTFSGIDPLSTPPKQTLSADKLDLGIPLRDLEVVFALPGDGSLRVDSATAGVAGGRVEAGPSVLRLAPDGGEMRLDIRGVDLAILLDDLDAPRFETDARLTGSVSIGMADGDLVLMRGRLDADSAGFLRRVPGDRAAPFGPAEGTANPALDALSNFRFDTLEIAIDRAAGGATELSVRIAGSDPEFYEGSPIGIDIGLAGDLDDFLLRGPGAWRFEEEIR